MRIEASLQNTTLLSVYNLYDDANPCALAKKHVFGSEGTAVGMGCQTLAFVGWHFLFFLFSNLQSCYCCVVFLACVQRLRLKAGGHFGALHCQSAIKFISCNTVQIGTICPLDFSLCYQPGVVHPVGRADILFAWLW